MISEFPGAVLLYGLFRPSLSHSVTHSITQSIVHPCNPFVYPFFYFGLKLNDIALYRKSFILKECYMKDFLSVFSLFCLSFVEFMSVYFLNIFVIQFGFFFDIARNIKKIVYYKQNNDRCYFNSVLL